MQKGKVVLAQQPLNTCFSLFPYLSACDNSAVQIE